VLTASRPGIEGGLRISYATLGAFMKYPKESLPKKPTKNIADKKYGFFQTDKKFFKEAAEDMGLIPNKSGDDIGFERHPLAYLVEAADDICYTIIDFEDGINLGLVSEDFALEYLIKLVKDSIDSSKYKTLTTKEDRISYLRALAIGSLINDAVKVFIDNEEAILNGKFPFALTDKSKYKAQMDDIISISVNNIYQSREVIEKEIVGYQIIQTLLDKFITAYDNTYNGNASNYDTLILKLLPEKHQFEKEDLYERLLHICHFISLLTDGNALELFETINGKKKD
jgi:dGTPase